MSGATAQELAVRTKVATVADTTTLLQKVDSPGRLYAPVTKAQLVIDMSLVVGTNVQAYDAGLLSLAGLTYAAAAFVKMTGANTFVLRTIGDTADDLQGTIDHNLLANYDGNKHVDHTGVSISTGTGLTGGGTIAANRTLSLDISGLDADASPDESADYVVTYDANVATHKKVLLSNLPGGIDGPGSSVDNTIVRWDGAGGDSLQSSNIIISDAGLLTTDTEGVAFLGEEYATGADVWASPTSVSDPDNDWDNEWYTIDENENTNATKYFDNYGWQQHYLEFTFPEVSCDKFRVLGYKSADGIKVRGNYYDGSWHVVDTIYLPAAKAWIEFSLGAMRTITKLRLEFDTTNDGNYAYIYEVVYNDCDVVETAQYKTILKTGEPHADLTLTLPLVDGAANQALKTNGSGVLSWGGHDDLADFVGGEHFLQTAITNVSTGLSTGLLKVTTGSGALSVLETDIAAAELEELSDGSQTALHSHAGGGATFLSLTDTPVSYDSADIGKYIRVKDDLSGLEFAEVAGGGAGGGGYLGYIKLSDVKAQNTNGGTFTSGAWRTRDLNTEDLDTNDDCSLASNQITLAAGTYECLISCPVHIVGRHQTRLYNATGAAVILIGTSEFTSTAYDNRSFIVGRFTIAASQALEVQHRCEATKADNGFGVPSNFTSEVYTIAEFWRVDEDGGGAATFLDLTDTPASYDSADIGKFTRVKDDLSGLEFAECAGGAGGGGSYLGYTKLSDVKAQNTAGGTFTSGAWRTRTLNTEDTDTNNDCSLASNQITLAAGTYECLISCPAYFVNRHQTRLYNTTGATVILTGTSEACDPTVGGHSVTRSFIVGRFTIAASQALEIQHRCQTTKANDGFGAPGNFTSEVYTIAEFWRVDEDGGGAGFTSRCSVYLSSNQSINHATTTKIAFDTEVYDNDSEFTDGRFTAIAAGYYHVSFWGFLYSIANDKYLSLMVYKNATKVAAAASHAGAGAYGVGDTVSVDVYLNGSTDYIEAKIYHEHGSARNLGGGRENTGMTIHRIGSAAEAAFTSRCRVYKSSAQSVATGSTTTITLDTEEYDNNNEFADNKFTAKVASWYHVSANAVLDSLGADKYFALDIRKNVGETRVASSLFNPSTALSSYCHVSTDVYLEVDDYIYLTAYHTHGTNRNIRAGTSYTFLSVHRFA